MNQAESIREFVLDNYICQARSEGRSEITVRAGDVHQRMGLSSRMPAVCSAVGGNKFCELAHVSLLDRTGPTQGANVFFTFDLTTGQGSRLRNPRPKAVLKESPKPTKKSQDLSDAVVLVSCVKSKLTVTAPARELYASTWFRYARRLVEASGSRWFILSALHGVVAPETEIAPYELTLKTLPVAERRAWAAKVLKKLLPELDGQRRVVILAGQQYREFLTEPLQQNGIEVDVPMVGLGFGEQLSWLSKQG